MNQRNQSDLKVDGNAIGGLLSEIFTMEMIHPLPKRAHQRTAPNTMIR